jgi:hypothetical protein
MATKVREASFSDFANFYPHPNNLEEIKVSLDIDPDMCLAILWDHSKEKIVAELEGNLVCLCGIVPPNNFWLFFSRDVTSLPLSFFKASREIAGKIIEVYGYAEGRIYSQNTFALQWAKWAGWTIEPGEPYGNEGKIFHRFHIGKEE